MSSCHCIDTTHRQTWIPEMWVFFSKPSKRYNKQGNTTKREKGGLLYCLSHQNPACISKASFHKQNASQPVGHRWQTQSRSVCQVTPMLCLTNGKQAFCVAHLPWHRNWNCHCDPGCHWVDSQGQGWCAAALCSRWKLCSHAASVATPGVSAQPLSGPAKSCHNQKTDTKSTAQFKNLPTTANQGDTSLSLCGLLKKMPPRQFIADWCTYPLTLLKLIADLLPQTCFCSTSPTPHLKDGLISAEVPLPPPQRWNYFSSSTPPTHPHRWTYFSSSTPHHTPTLKGGLISAVVPHTSLADRQWTHFYSLSPHLPPKLIASGTTSTVPPLPPPPAPPPPQLIASGPTPTPPHPTPGLTYLCSFSPSSWLRMDASFWDFSDSSVWLTSACWSWCSAVVALVTIRERSCSSCCTWEPVDIFNNTHLHWTYFNSMHTDKQAKQACFTKCDAFTQKATWEQTDMFHKNVQIYTKSTLKKLACISI